MSGTYCFDIVFLFTVTCLILMYQLATESQIKIKSYTANAAFYQSTSY